MQPILHYEIDTTFLQNAPSIMNNRALSPLFFFHLTS